MDTIVWSMNVIDTAKIIAARIRFFDRPALALATAVIRSQAYGLERSSGALGSQGYGRPWAGAAPASASSAPHCSLRRKTLNE